MSPLWVLAIGIVLLGAAALTFAARRTRDEIAPTVQAFAEFRAALQPAVAALHTESADARRRLDDVGSGIRRTQR